MKITFQAADKSGMTLEELAKFVEQMKANGATGQEVPKATFSIKGKLQALEASVA